MHEITSSNLPRPILIRFFVTLTLITLFAGSAIAQFVPQSPSNWYNIEPWEVKTCAKWGGRFAPERIANVPSGLTGFGPFTYSAVGKKVRQQGTNETLYYYAYYLESYAAELHYSIDLYDAKTQRRKPLASGTLLPHNGVQDQFAEYLKENYSHLRIMHQLGTVVIPLVEVSS